MLGSRKKLLIIGGIALLVIVGGIIALVFSTTRNQQSSSNRNDYNGKVEGPNAPPEAPGPAPAPRPSGSEPSHDEESPDEHAMEDHSKATGLVNASLLTNHFSLTQAAFINATVTEHAQRQLRQDTVYITGNTISPRGGESFGFTVSNDKESLFYVIVTKQPDGNVKVDIY